MIINIYLLGVDLKLRSLYDKFYITEFCIFYNFNRPCINKCNNVVLI